MNDTHPDIERELHARLMARSGEERLKMGADMFSSSMILMRAGISATYGELSEVEMRAKLLERLYGDELSETVRREIASRHPARPSGRRHIDRWHDQQARGPHR